MRIGKRAFIIVLVLCSCVGCDQMSKDLVVDNLRYAPSVVLWRDTVHLLYAEYPGAAFSLWAVMQP